MILAVEDALSEAVVRRLVAEFQPTWKRSAIVGLKGKGYLKQKARSLNQTAQSLPVFLLVDQDSPNVCPVDTIVSWLGAPPQRNLLFRFAVMEIESWVLADRVRFASFLSIADHRIPQNPDIIIRPKEFIIQLARGSRSMEIRRDLVPQPGATAAVGPAYNARLADFVARSWSPRRAARTSPSLARAVDRLSDM